MINKVIRATDESWVSVTEYPDKTLALEGIRNHPEEYRAFLTTRIRFSKEAVKALIPLMQEWIDE